MHVITILIFLTNLNFRIHCSTSIQSSLMFKASIFCREKEPIIGCFCSAFWDLLRNICIMYSEKKPCQRKLINWLVGSLVYFVGELYGTPVKKITTRDDQKVSSPLFPDNWDNFSRNRLRIEPESPDSRQRLSICSYCTSVEWGPRLSALHTYVRTRTYRYMRVRAKRWSLIFRRLRRWALIKHFRKKKLVNLVNILFTIKTNCLCIPLTCNILPRAPTSRRRTGPARSRDWPAWSWSSPAKKDQLIRITVRYTNISVINMMRTYQLSLYSMSQWSRGPLSTLSLALITWRLIITLGSWHTMNAWKKEDKCASNDNGSGCLLSRI